MTMLFRLTRDCLLRCLATLWVLLIPLWLSAQGDARRPITRSTMYGWGTSHLYDTYLSPLSYTGSQLRVLRESGRALSGHEGRLSRQILFQGHLALCSNRPETANELAGMVNWNYALHYRFSIIDNRLRLFVGPMWQLHGGFTYNTRNGNNPAQARLYTNLAASFMCQYDIPWQRLPLTLRYQADVPFLGLMFSPRYGQSYYEIFSLGHTGDILHLTSFHNQPTLRHWLTADFRLRRFTLRVGYMADMQQARVSGLRAHDYSHTFLVGLVKKLTMDD